MMRILKLRIACFLLAIATVGAVWYWLNAGLVNDSLDVAESVAKWLSGSVARLFGVDVYKTEAIVAGKMHLDRTLYMSTLMLAWAVAIEFVFREYFGRNTLRTVLAIVIVHTALIFAWIMWTPTMEWWYTVHANVLEAVFRFFGWDKAETLFLKLLKIQSIVVLGEAFLIYFALTSRIGRRR